ncbi:hypothetical protein MRX96_006714 [Rhipicephalus microplus]
MEKKAAIIKLVKSGRSQADVSKEFVISKQTVSGFLRNKDKILEAAEKPSDETYSVHKTDAAVPDVTNGWLVFASDQEGAPMREGMPLR